MGLRGPAPKPTALKELAGNPGKRKLNAAEPKPDRTMPKCPTWMRAEAKVEWKRVAKRLHDMGVLTYVDRAVLAAYCQAWALWSEAEQMVDKTAQVVKGKTGSFYMNPWLQAAVSARKDMMKLASELGMSPSSRSRITAEPIDNGHEKTLAEMLFEEVNG